MSVYAPNVARVMQKRGLLGSGSVLVSQSITTPGAGTFTVPAGVTSLTIEVWGSGASGSPSGSSTTPGGGGGGYAKSIVSVTQAQTVYYSVGAGAAKPGGGTVGNAGAASWANRSANSSPASPTDGAAAAALARAATAAMGAAGPTRPRKALLARRERPMAAQAALERRLPFRPPTARPRAAAAGRHGAAARSQAAAAMAR